MYANANHFNRDFVLGGGPPANAFDGARRTPTAETNTGARREIGAGACRKDSATWRGEAFVGDDREKAWASSART
jgi:hypothetical protein